jgi:hypothetical protein
MSRLEELGKEFREQLLPKNAKINPNNPYNISHTNAVSDGDEHGKNPDGSQVDIEAREKLLARNKFNKNKEYNHSNA